MKPKSLKINMLLNGIKGVLSVLFPFLTFPYVSKILGVENIGKYNFANSIISYFVLLAGLGISTYAIREGASVRENKEKLNQFSNEVFTINLISTIFSYLFLFILLLIVPKFKSYNGMIILLSLQIIFKTIGIEWVYSIYEDYKYITIRSIIFQILSLLLLFLLVHTENDLYTYIIITIISSVGSNILNFIHSKKYLNVSITKDIKLKKHMKPIFILFATSIAITIYVNSDITILGFLTNDYHVGIYSVSTKVYTIIKSLLSSVIVVSIPRLSALLAQKKEDDFKEISTEIYKTFLTLIIPSVIGLIVLSQEIVLIISDTNYLQASSSLSFLSIALFFCLGAGFWGQAMLLPLRMESKIFKITIISAIVNIVLNILLIPIFKENAAALTTIIAEAISFIYCKYEAKKIITIGKFNQILMKSLLGSISIVVLSLIIKNIISELFLSTMFIIVLSIPCYVIIELILKNEIVLYYLEKIKKKIKNNT